MTYFLLAASLLLFTVNTPQPVGATTTLSVTINPPLSTGETYANAWAAAGPTPTVAQPCGTNGTGVRHSDGSLVECPAGASTGTTKSATGGNGDKATASAWAKIDNGVGTANAPVNIPSKPQVFAGAAAYAKANLAVPVIAKGSGKIGGNFSITYGNLTVNGWSEPVDARVFLWFDNSRPDQIPNVFKNVLDGAELESLLREGYTFAPPDTTIYYSISLDLLVGNNEADTKVKVGKPSYFKEHLPSCPNNFQQMLQACLISGKSPSERNFITTCKPGSCRPGELKNKLDDTYKTELYIPGEYLTDYVSVHEISCVKSRGPDHPPQTHDDICSLLLRFQGGSRPE